MSEQTQEEVVRYRDLQKIKTEEEYEAALRRLEYYKKEYTWMQQTADPLREVKKELEELLPMFNGEKTESQRYFLRCINLLNAKAKQIERGEYLSNLKRNITALLVTTRQYKQRQEEYSVLQILIGIVKRDKAILEALKMDNLFERAISFGKIPAEKDLSLQEPGELVEYIGKHYDLVGIQVPDYRQNLALVPVNPGRITAEQKFVSEMVAEYLGGDLSGDRQRAPDISTHRKRYTRKTRDKEVIQSEKIPAKDNNSQQEGVQKSEKVEKKIDSEGEIE